MPPSDAVMGTYNRFALSLQRGKGCWVWDDKSRRHLDAVAGIATCTLGHSNRAMRKALTGQLRKLQLPRQLFNQLTLMQCNATTHQLETMTPIMQPVNMSNLTMGPTVPLLECTP